MSRGRGFPPQMLRLRPSDYARPQAGGEKYEGNKEEI